jgi:hypothetical protein
MTEQSQELSIADGLRQIAALPGWLTAALQADQVVDGLRRRVPEFASGKLVLKGCKVRRLLLKDTSGRWAGTYNLAVEEPGTGQARTVQLIGTLTAPGLRAPASAEPPSGEHEFGSADWRCELPELGLEFEMQPPDTALPAMPQLTDAEESRALLERGIAAGAPAYHDLTIQTCAPQVLSYKPGSRCVIRYHLHYPAEFADRGWPATVIAKTYRKESKGRNAYDGMLALWRSPLAAGDVVTIAEPLAYIPELKVLVQGPVPEQQTLEDLLKSALKAGTPEALEELNGFMRKTAAGLAAFHQSGARHGETITLDDLWPEIDKLIDRLAVPAPDLARSVMPLLARLKALEVATPADPTVPTHGTFSPEQVLIDRGRIGFIDFDDFCLVEPAMDVGLFRVAIKDIGMNALAGDASREARQGRLAQLDAICEVFLSAYEAHAPISRQRIALWEAWSYFRDSLHYWSKVKPAEPDNALMMLDQHLHAMSLL